MPIPLQDSLPAVRKFSSSASTPHHFWCLPSENSKWMNFCLLTPSMIEGFAQLWSFIVLQNTRTFDDRNLMNTSFIGYLSPFNSVSSVARYLTWLLILFGSIIISSSPVNLRLSSWASTNHRFSVKASRWFLGSLAGDSEGTTVLWHFLICSSLSRRLFCFNKAEAHNPWWLDSAFSYFHDSTRASSSIKVRRQTDSNNSINLYKTIILIVWLFCTNDWQNNTTCWRQSNNQ